MKLFDKIIYINNLEELNINIDNLLILKYNYVSDSIDKNYTKFLKQTNPLFKNKEEKYIYYFLILYKAIEYIQLEEYKNVLFRFKYFDDIILSKEEREDILTFTDIETYFNKINFKKLELKKDNTNLYITNYNNTLVDKNIIEPTTINIFLSITANFIPKLYVLLYSLLKYSLSKFNVYILIDEKEADYYIQFEPFQTLKMNIKLIDNKLFSTIFKTKQNYGNKTTYGRMIAPILFPDLDKILYLDADTLVINKGIEYLYNIDMKDKYYAACELLVFYFNPNHDGWARELSLYKNIKNIYFSAGILLQNLKQLRNEKFTNILIHYLLTTYTRDNLKLFEDYFQFIKQYDIKDNVTTWTYNDQSLLNYIVKDLKLILFNPIFNSLNELIFNLDNITFNEYIKKWNFRDYELFTNNIIIYHYIGYNKPWDEDFINKEKFMNPLLYRKNLKWYEMKLETDLYLKSKGFNIND